MRTSGKSVLYISAAAALLAGCAGSQPPISPLGSLAQRRLITTHAYRGESWMLPEAKHEDLLYVAAQDPGDIHVFAYPSNKKVGEIANVSGGECVDTEGNVFIANGTEVLEYHHGATTPFKKLSYANLEQPDSCAVDPKTGDLAVTNASNSAPSGNDASVFIFHHANREVNYYYDSDLGSIWSCAYDDSGNLFIVSTANLAELPRHGKHLNTITVAAGTRTSLYLYGAQWDGQYLAVGSNESGGSRGVTGIYRLSVSGSTATVRGNVLFEKTSEFFEFWIQGATLVAPGFNNPGCGRTGCVAFYSYPSGGKYTGYIRLSYPVAAAVSVVPSR